MTDQMRPPAGRPSYEAVILAGGKATRFGGRSKPDVCLDGERLVDRVCDAVRAEFNASGAHAVPITIVGPQHLARDGVEQVREDPPFGGPVAALISVLPRFQAKWIVLLPCDLELPNRAVHELWLAHSRQMQNEKLADVIPTDGTVLCDSDSRPQWLLGIYLRESLASVLECYADDGANRSLKETVGTLSLNYSAAASADLADIDTPELLELARKRAAVHRRSESRLTNRERSQHDSA